MQFLVTLFILYVVYKAFTGKSDSSQRLREAFNKNLDKATGGMTQLSAPSGGASQSSGTYQGRAYSVRYITSGEEDGTLISMVLTSAVHSGLSVDISPRLSQLFGNDRSDWDASAVNLDEYIQVHGPKDSIIDAQLSNPDVKEAIAQVVGRTGDCAISNRHLELWVGSRVRKAAVLEIYLEWLHDSAEALESALETAARGAEPHRDAPLAQRDAPLSPGATSPILEPPPLLLPPKASPKVGAPSNDAHPLEIHPPQRELILTIPDNMTLTPAPMAPSEPPPPPPPTPKPDPFDLEMPSSSVTMGSASSSNPIDPKPPSPSTPEAPPITGPSAPPSPPQAVPQALKDAVEALKDWRLSTKDRETQVAAIGALSLTLKAKELRASHGLPSTSKYANGKTLVGEAEGLEVAIQLTPGDPRAQAFSRGDTLAVRSRAVDWDSLYDRLVMQALD